ncbi:F-box/FBD/LRR-repeat protein [Cardamine amara subsp. amara]|uniref:F-box/FBD/LRR-repeat protein n=1 Tax=Cardamine amara subsp. amara TaxID=228776 RepID=A0ABD1A602_CARAN
MDEAGEKRVCGSSEVDWLSNLPESLIFKVLLKLGTKDVVRCSALSSRWRNLWKYIPKLDLEGDDFHVPIEIQRLADPDCPSKYDRCVSFVDRFLGFNSDSCLESFRLVCPGDGDREADYALIRRWMDIVIKRKVKHLEYFEDSWESDEFQIPPTIYTCESLVYLKLCRVTMSTPGFFSLPSLKVMYLNRVTFPDDLDIERLISGCPVLENLDIEMCFFIQVLRVCSQSLLTFTLDMDNDWDLVENLLVVIDAPRLEYLKLNDYQTASFIIKNPDSLAKVDIDVVFSLSDERRFDPGDLLKRNMICNFLGSISCVKDMTISSTTLEVIYDYSRCEPLPLFRNLSSLRVEFTHYSWEMLPIFLESCPNLKSLVLVYNHYLKKGIDISPGPRCFLASLEHVNIERAWNREAIEMVKLVSYFLENSTILKKLTLCLAEFRKKEEYIVILKELLTIPRLSTSCQVVVL